MKLLNKFKLQKFLQFILKKFNLKMNYFMDNDYFDFKKFIFNYMKKKEKIYFVQIGGNDGILNDPIYDLCKKFPEKFYGYIFEPVPEYFSELKQNYKFSNNISLLNLAINNSSETAKIFKVKKNFLNKLDDLSKGIASFQKDWWKTKSNFVKDINMIEEIDVKCVHTHYITNNLNIDHIDLLIIDTEGYDFEILKNFEFNKSKPNIIHFEHGLIDDVMNEDKFNEIKDLLSRHGYNFIFQNYDLTAYQMNSLIN